VDLDSAAKTARQFQTIDLPRARAAGIRRRRRVVGRLNRSPDCRPVRSRSASPTKAPSRRSSGGPTWETLANPGYFTARIDIATARSSDLAAQRPKVRTRAFRKSLDKGLLITTLLNFCSCRARALAARATPDERRATQPGRTSRTSLYYDVSNAFYALWLDKEMSTPALLHRLGQRYRPDATGQLEINLPEIAVAAGRAAARIGCGWARWGAMPRSITA